MPVKHKCGHRVWFPDKKSIPIIKAYPCPRCRRRLADEEADKLNIPRLQGTDKQIAWAADIRRKAASRKDFKTLVLECTLAAWWIENRGNLKTT